MGVLYDIVMKLNSDKDNKSSKEGENTNIKFNNIENGYKTDIFGYKIPNNIQEKTAEIADEYRTNGNKDYNYENLSRTELSK